MRRWASVPAWPQAASPHSRACPQTLPLLGEKSLTCGEDVLYILESSYHKYSAQQGFEKLLLSGLPGEQTHVFSWPATVGIRLLLEKQRCLTEQTPAPGAGTVSQGQGPSESYNIKLYGAASLSEAKNNFSQENI